MATELSSRYLFTIPFLALIAVLTISSMYRLSPTPDEPSHYSFGEKALSGTISQASMQRMPITALNVVPVRLLEISGATLSWQTRLFVSRLPTMCISLLLAFSVFIWSSRIYGFRGGLLSLALYSFCPNFLAHAGLVTTDVYCACFMFLATFYFTAYLRNQTIANLAIAAVLTGIAQVTKQTALILLPVFAVWYVLHRVNIRKRLVHALLYLFIVIMVLNTAYCFRGPFLPVSRYAAHLNSNTVSAVCSFVSWLPVPLPWAYVQALMVGVSVNSMGTGHWPVYLFGKLSVLGWWYYFPAAFALKFPLPLIPLVVMAAIKRKMMEHDEKVVMSVVAAIMSFFCIFCTAQIGVRYLLPAVPFLYVYAGGAAGAGSFRFRILHGGLVLWFIMSSLSYYPHYLSYFNECVINRKHSYKYLADSNIDWGQNAYYLERYLNRHSGEKITVNPSQPVTGTVIVNVNALVGIGVDDQRKGAWSADQRKHAWSVDQRKYAWLRDSFEPAEHIAYSWLVFRVPESYPAGSGRSSHPAHE
jgi:hypothetical protein